MGKIILVRVRVCRLRCINGGYRGCSNRGFGGKRRGGQGGASALLTVCYTFATILLAVCFAFATCSTCFTTLCADVDLVFDYPHKSLGEWSVTIDITCKRIANDSESCICLHVGSRKHRYSIEPLAFECHCVLCHNHSLLYCISLSI